MNKQCQQPQAHPDRCGCVRENAEHNAQAYAEAIAALAAKDARVAELEQKIIGLEDAFASNLDYRAMYRQLRAQLASQQQAEPKPLSQFVAECEARDPQMMAEAREWAKTVAQLAATPSEDGREVPEVVGHLLLGGPADQDELEDNDIDLDMKIVERLQVELVTKGSGVILALMTVAQHSRIVAAKDAEIARLKTDNEKRATMDRYCMEQRRIREKAEEAFKFEKECREEVEAELNELRAIAQPARQVGGDERELFEAWLSSLKFVAGQGQEHVAYCLHRDLGDKYTVEWVSDMWRGWQARAALAPVAVVMPERVAVRDAIAEALGDAYDCIRVWHAWQVGTMGPDDFVPVAEQEDRLAELVDAVFAEFARLNANPITAAELEALRSLAAQAADALQVFTGHDYGANLRHRYGEKWWEPLDELRDKIRAAIAQHQEGGSHE